MARQTLKWWGSFTNTKPRLKFIIFIIPFNVTLYGLCLVQILWDFFSKLTLLLLPPSYLRMNHLQITCLRRCSTSLATFFIYCWKKRHWEFPECILCLQMKPNVFFLTKVLRIFLGFLNQSTGRHCLRFPSRESTWVRTKWRAMLMISYRFVTACCFSVKSCLNLHHLFPVS